MALAEFDQNRDEEVSGVRWQANFQVTLRVVIFKKLLTTSVFLISFTSHLLYIHILYTEGTPTKAASI